MAFLRLRWLRPSVVWALTATLSAFRLLPPLFREGETEVLVFSTLLLVEAVLLLVYPRGAARPYVFRNSRGGAVTAFVAEGALALPLVIPAAWLSLAPSAGSPGESPWFLWPAVLPWVLQVRTARGPIGPELLVRAGMAAGGALVSPVILLFPAEETRAVAMLVLAALLVGGEEVRERAAARAVTSPWQEGEEATIVAVVDGSPAAELGIRPGMRLVGVNGTPVRGPQDAYAALQGRPAYVKLELKDADGEILYRERGRYEGDLPLLGIVFAPRRFDPRRSAPPPEHGIALLRGFPSVRRAEAASGETPEVSPAPAPPPAQPPSGGIISEEWRG
ncbi:MAG: hypothetical protein KM296_02705 [Brockia lithotrophica]|nr:hypothetical protein [Brockia lithotrophica]